MRRVLATAIAVGLAALFLQGSAGAVISAGSSDEMDLNIGAILQAGFVYYTTDQHLGNAANTFQLNRTRMIMSGAIIPERVRYFMQAELVNEIAILDYRASFYFIPKTEVAFGRFLPNFTLYMPYSTASLEMIRYPLTTQVYGMFRQVGLQTTTVTEHVDFNVGVFNGADIVNNFRDNNDAKDLFARVDLKPPLADGEARIGAYYWLNRKSVGPEFTEDADETYSNNRIGIFGKLDYPLSTMLLKLRAEFLLATDEHGNPDDPDEVDSDAWFAHAGVQLTDNWEVLARYDAHDPNTDDDAEDDSESILTLGVNYYLKDINSMFYLDYGLHMYEEPDADNVGYFEGQVQIAF